MHVAFTLGSYTRFCPHGKKLDFLQALDRSCIYYVTMYIMFAFSLFLLYINSNFGYGRKFESTRPSHFLSTAIVVHHMQSALVCDIAKTVSWDKKVLGSLCGSIQRLALHALFTFLPLLLLLCGCLCTRIIRTNAKLPTSSGFAITYRFGWWVITFLPYSQNVFEKTKLMSYKKADIFDPLNNEMLENLQGLSCIRRPHRSVGEC